MIHTSADRLTILYDRKSKRHNWQIIVALGDEEKPERLNCLAAGWQERARRSNWGEYQQGILKLKDFGGVFHSSLPKNYKGMEVIYDAATSK